MRRQLTSKLFGTLGIAVVLSTAALQAQTPGNQDDSATSSSQPRVTITRPIAFNAPETPAQARACLRGTVHLPTWTCYILQVGSPELASPNPLCSLTPLE